MTFSIRVLESVDVELAQQLFAFFQVAFDEKQSAPPSREYLQRLLAKDDFHAVVALQNGAVVGGLTAYELEMLNETHELFIYDIAVGAAHRRQGVGSALIKFTQELSVSRGVGSLYVGAMANEADAVRFYETTGLQREDVAWFSQEFD